MKEQACTPNCLQEPNLPSAVTAGKRVAIAARIPPRPPPASTEPTGQGPLRTPQTELAESYRETQQTLLDCRATIQRVEETIRDAVRELSGMGPIWINLYQNMQNGNIRMTHGDREEVRSALAALNRALDHVTTLDGSLGNIASRITNLSNAVLEPVRRGDLAAVQRVGGPAGCTSLSTDESIQVRRDAAAVVAQLRRMGEAARRDARRGRAARLRVNRVALVAGPHGALRTS